MEENSKFEIIKVTDELDVMGIEFINRDFLSTVNPNLFDSNELSDISSTALVDVSVLSEVICGVNRIVNASGTNLILDFDSLPLDVKDKLRKKIYRIGESKTVEGNLRSVIVDETGTRVKDITLKKVVETPSMCDVTRSIGMQLVMRQIIQKLDSINESLDYLMDSQRANMIKVPLISARDYVIRAQKECQTDRINDLLLKASDKLNDGLNAAYIDFDEAFNHLKKVIKIPFFQINRDKYIGIMTEDFFVINTYFSLYLSVLNYLGDYSSSVQVGEKHMVFLKRFFQSENSPSQLLCDYYPYTKENMDFWFVLRNKFYSSCHVIESNQTVVLSIGG